MKRSEYSAQRSKYIDEIEKLRLGRSDAIKSQIEEILFDYGATDDDSDRYEGFYVTMSTPALKDAYEEIAKICGRRTQIEREFSAIEGLLTEHGFKEHYSEGPDGAVFYFSKGGVGLVVCTPSEAKDVADSLA